MEVTLDRTAHPGKTFRLKVVAINAVGSAKSNIVSVVAATIPGDPTVTPTVVQADTNENQITVQITAITDTGSSPITSYELQSDNGIGGSFSTVKGGDNSQTLSTTFTLTSDIVRGIAYRFRYRSRNIVGWSGWSPIASLSASTVPDAPPRPTYVSSTNNTISLAFSRSTDNGGNLIINYELEVDGDIITDYVFSTHGYFYTADRRLLILPTVILTTGEIYRFKYRAQNSNGYSLWSQPTSIAFAPLPSPPSGLVRSTTGNSETSISLDWTENTGEALPVLQYILYVNDGSTIDNIEINRGSSTSFIMTNTNPGSQYSFYVSAENFNGEGTLSTVLELTSCVAPFSIFPPSLVESTSTSLRLRWQSPGSTGGCEVTSYGLLRDDGASGLITTPVSPATIANKPSLFEHTEDMTGFTGMKVRFKLQVSNVIDGVTTTITSTGFLTVLVAGVPPQPSQIVVNSEDISGSQIGFRIPEISDDGGSYIATYHVEMDNGEDFETISGYPIYSFVTDFTISEGIQMASTYAVRYRVKNSIGWSLYSDITYILAAERPSSPDQPIFVSSTSAALTIEFGTSFSNGGAEITSYMIQVNREDGNGYIDLTTYTASTTTQAITIDSGNITALQPGLIYRFRSFATNAAGFTSYSLELRIAAAELPAQPSSPPVWVEDLSSLTSIAVNWDYVSSTQIATTGYKLFRDGGNDGHYSLIYDGTNRPGHKTYISENLETGRYYRFKYLAMNYNGEGPKSDESLIPVCLPPSQLNAPVFTSGTTTTINLEWVRPMELGGCSLNGYRLYQGTTSDTALTVEVDTSLNTNPFAKTITVTFGGGNEGTKYRFQLEAITDVGSVKSGIMEVTLSGVPDAPTAGPTKLAAQTNDTQITVIILDTVQNYNGGTLKRVHLQMDNNGDGNFTDIVGPENSCIDTIHTVSDGIVSGGIYQFRYRIMNQNGWSDFSPVTKIVAASTPSFPPRPTLVSATSSQIQLAFSRPKYNGGSSIILYELYING